MLKQNIVKIIKECADGSALTKVEKFQVFCTVCDNMLAEGRITQIQHQRWTNIF